jgi:hypothetical protein
MRALCWGVNGLVRSDPLKIVTLGEKKPTNNNMNLRQNPQAPVLPLARETTDFAIMRYLGLGVGLGRVVRKVRQHADDHEFESQRWQ